jgi:acetylornithine/N-succinyldiaminopimelate aminotransferase
MLGIKCKCPNLDFVQEGYEKAILTVPASDNVVRLLPALNITIEEINEALSRLEQTANSLRIAK